MQVALLVVALAAALCIPSSSDAGLLGPSKASDLRTVQGTAGSVKCPGFDDFNAVDTQQNPNGTHSPFTIPPKSVFIVTSLDTTNTGSVGTSIATYLVASGGGPFFSLVAQCPSTIGSDGFGFGSCTIPSGVPVKAGTTLCFFPLGSVVIVHGFIAKDK